MASADFEKIAATFATQAVLQKAVPADVRTKQAAIGYDDVTKFLSTPEGKYLLGGVGGAGLGALVGAMQPKRKGRNAMYYGALGGLGGLGLAAVANNYGAYPAVNSSAARGSQTPPPNRFDAVMDNPKSTLNDRLEAIQRDPVDAITPTRMVKNVQDLGREFTGLQKDVNQLGQSTGRYVRQYVGSGQAGKDLMAGANRLNQARLDTGRHIGENYLYPAAKGIYDWWNG